MSVLAMTTTQCLSLDQADVAVMLTAKEPVPLMAIVEDAPFSFDCSDANTLVGRATQTGDVGRLPETQRDHREAQVDWRDSQVLSLVDEDGVEGRQYRLPTRLGCSSSSN